MKEEDEALKEDIEKKSEALKDTGLTEDLYKQTFSFTLDNSQNDFEFHYLLNGAAQSVRARGRQALTRPYPSLARYDDGQNHVKQTWLNYGGRKVAVAADGTVDLVQN